MKIDEGLSRQDERQVSWYAFVMLNSIVGFAKTRIELDMEIKLDYI